MIKLSREKEKKILYALVGAFLAALLINSTIIPVIKKYIFLDQRIEDARSKIKKYKWLNSHKAEIESRYSGYLPYFKADALKSDPIVSILSELENLAKQANIVISDIRPETSSNNAGRAEIVVNLRSEGKLEEYIKFAKDIEDSLFLSQIRILRLYSKNESQNLGADFVIAYPL
ncbi:MAG: hypothetical protein AABY55_04890 [Candidatus Omnitrophota bacterium]